jgi:3-oxoacyl-[acyl-carrier protein] reductase
VIDLTGDRVLVTGGSRGIGAACCRLFAQAGAAVLVHYVHHAERAAELLESLPAVPHAPHLSFAADVSREDEVEKLFAFLDVEWGKLDCVVNNAGVWVPDPLAAFDVRAYWETMDVNVLGSFLCAHAALPYLAKSDNASIVNVTSTAGQRGEPGYSPYAASKGAIISATKSWAVELAPRIRVNSVAPGWVDTDMTSEALTGAGREAALAAIPLRRIASAEDVAGSILFLASPLARHITGEILNVNGGSVLVG